MPVVRIEHNISSIWGGTLTGYLLKNDAAITTTEKTMKFIGIHGWLDNLNSMMPLAEKLIERHPSN